MKEILKAFEHKTPEIVFNWQDQLTEAKGWVVINSLRGGAAGGGTRMRVGLTQHEVLSLAKTMEVKFTVAGPAIGGAKSGIDFDPKDPRKKGVLERWYKAVKPLLKNYYGTGGDLNVDQKHEVIPITSAIDIHHPQEGVMRGHFNPSGTEEIQKITNLQLGVSMQVSNPELTPNSSIEYKVGDMITGYGVSESVYHFYNIYGGTLAGKRVIIQGWGNVASAAAYYLAQHGAKIVGIIDRVGGLINEEGYSFEEITALFNSKDGNALSAEDIMSFDEVNNRIWDVPAEVFIPAAASRLVSQDQLDRMLSNGLEVISAGANVPFADQEIFYGSISEHADKNCAVIPDFISNCGMARVFGYLMATNDELTDTRIFEDVSETIKSALDNTHSRNADMTLLTSTAYEIALDQLM